MRIRKKKKMKSVEERYDNFRAISFSILFTFMSRMYVYMYVQCSTTMRAEHRP